MVAVSSSRTPRVSDTDDPFVLLVSSSSMERLRGARLLYGDELSETDRLRTSQLLSHETDSWVQLALNRALQREGNDASKLPPASPPVDQDLEDVRAQAIAAVAQTLLHEIRPLVGDLDEAASDEIGEAYESSATFRAIERLKSLLRTIGRYEEASHAPRYAEFDLTDAVVREISAYGPWSVAIRVGRDEPVPAGGDWELLKLSFINGLRNAVEASQDSGAPVVINWGVTDRDAWVAILDSGAGLPPGLDGAFEAGTTNKSKETNQGWGLTIARRAMNSCGGEISLRPRTPNGAAFEMRWPIQAAPLEDSAG